MHVYLLASASLIVNLGCLNLLQTSSGTMVVGGCSSLNVSSHVALQMRTLVLEHNRLTGTLPSSWGGNLGKSNAASHDQV